MDEQVGFFWIRTEVTVSDETHDRCRIPLNTQLEAQLKASNDVDRAYRENQLWYDAIDRLAERHFANATNAEVNKTWHQLLQTLDFTLDLPRALHKLNNYRTYALTGEEKCGESKIVS